jgi:phenylalanyl-tRNA synthetase beta chain
MPTVAVDKERFLASLGRTYTVAEFDELCFQFGIELDDDTTEECQKAGNGERSQLKIDIPANRYDLLCHEGISRALRVFLGQMEQPQIKLTQPKDIIQVRVDDKVDSIRPVFLGAVLRNITFTPENYASFIDLQDKLHQNLGRRRTLVSMGTHDLDTISTPIYYHGLAPAEVKFAPLNRPGQVMDGPTLMSTLEADRHLSRYLSIIRDSPVYPVVLDANKTVCSLPPIINSEHSKITLKTKNVFIDMTGTDETRCQHALSELVSMFSQYCGEEYTVEPVEVIYPSGRAEITPNLEARRTTASVASLI